MEVFTKQREKNKKKNEDEIAIVNYKRNENKKKQNLKKGNIMAGIIDTTHK